MTVKTEVKTYQNLINGQWVDAQKQEVEKSINPADYREIVGYVPLSTAEDVDMAVKAAKSAFPHWSKLSGGARGDVLRKAADLMEQRVNDIAETLTREMGKTLAEAKGEVMRAVAILRYYSSEGMRSIGEVIPSNEEGTLLFTSRSPLGVVGLITPWNFPVAIPIWKMAPALIYGNTVVMKPALEATVTAMKVMECLQEAGFPPGVINVVSGSGSKVGNALTEHPDVKAISFTGSNQVGQLIALKALERGAKYQLEMGGKNPVVVTQNADLELAAELTVSGSMKSSGQKCTATSRAIVVKEVYDEFREKVLQKVKGIKVGNGLAADTYMGPVASQNQYHNVLAAIQKGIDEGGHVVWGGKPLDQDEMAYGYFIEPTLIENVDPSMWIAQEEVFGPVLALIKVDSLDEALQVANDVKYGLSASIFTNHLNEVFQYLNEIEAGMIRVNGESSGVELQAPFGGVKASSTQAREQGRAAMEFFTTIKTVTIKA
ncbi:alpha-ketoglutaric semialdehyde dehydrogenase GucD [Ammoniphilus sp. CFH 90114]|uniref:alpha-ketoglutaric semialdehyde dehydrogenase GucD n=1 Tax=Ammoniphilus sp. CFH 90114 TaxID=2493665 RepID=UPI00100DEB3A|nr:alpha-ketoglutaric semialdehyde dehydrogenase GucD [Ammoniphilus sp. CFH 90114]RXT07901.1 aldehyde dehydrogenase family protein [Ammoniphilus sp. CFH 90114]